MGLFTIIVYVIETVQAESILLPLPTQFSIQFCFDTLAAGQLSTRLKPIPLSHALLTQLSSSPPKMKTSTTLSLSALSLLSLPLSASAQYGNQFANALSTGPVASGSFIRESNTTLILPAVNSPQTGNLALWPGMGTSGGDLIQALAISYAQGGLAQGCPAGQGEGKWCIVASTLEGTQEMGQGVYAPEGGRMGIHCRFYPLVGVKG